VTDQGVQTSATVTYTEDKEVQTAVVPTGRPPVAPMSPSRGVAPQGYGGTCSREPSPDPSLVSSSSTSRGASSNKDPPPDSHAGFLETPRNSRQFSLAMTIERWHLPQAKHMCCAWHAATQALKVAVRQVAKDGKDACKPPSVFASLTGRQCAKCFCVGEEDEEVCITCGTTHTVPEESGSDDDKDAENCERESVPASTTYLSGDLSQLNSDCITQTFDASLVPSDEE